jgi:hypothetical protein
VPCSTIQLNQVIAVMMTGHGVVRRRHALKALFQLDECTFKFVSPHADSLNLSPRLLRLAVPLPEQGIIDARR